uniref:Uncharacterized protein n=1 Tax=Arundo donax TaxID=35708 RepID=A0A0A9FNF3_ARUDO
MRYCNLNYHPSVSVLQKMLLPCGLPPERDED